MKEKNKKLARKVVVVSMLLIILASMITPVGADDDGDSVLAENSDSYTIRSPIRINGNSDFASQASKEGWPGDGSAGNPYIIEGYEIDGTGHGIYVGNTSVYFSIRRCYIHNITGIEIDTQKGVPTETWVSNSGIGLFNVQNFILENNFVSNTQWDGISMHRVMDGSVNNNTVSRALNAIRLSDSENVYVGNNEIENDMGISVSNSSNNNTVTKNSVTGLDNSRGVGIGLSSSNNYINNNTISTYRYGIRADAEHTNFIGNNTFLNIGDEEIYRAYSEVENGNTGNSDTPFMGFALATVAILTAVCLTWKKRRRYKGEDPNRW